MTRTERTFPHWPRSVVFGEHTLKLSCSDRFPVTPYTEFLLNGFPDVSDQRVLDFGTGCGILALAAALRGAKEVVACDISESALTLTQENLRAHGYAHVRTILIGERKQDNLTGLLFDTIVSNPASLPTRGETEFFWSGGKMGLDMINTLIDVAAKHLVPGGRLSFVHTSLVPLNRTFARLQKRGLAAAILQSERLAFRGFYEELTGYFGELREQGLVFYDVMKDGTQYEFLYLVEAKHFERNLK